MWGISKFILIGALFFLPAQVLAFELEPNSVNTSGEEVHIQIRNTSDSVETYEASIEIVEIDAATGSVRFLGPAQDVATIDTTTFLLQPGEERRVIITPGLVPEGLYSLALLVTNQGNGTGVIVEEAIASLIFFTSGSAMGVPVVASLAVSAQHATIYAESIWRNTGDGLVIPSGGLVQTSVLGRTLRTDAVNQSDRRVLPDSERIFITEAPLTTGIFGLTRITYTAGPSRITKLIVRPHVTQVMLIFFLLTGIMVSKRRS
ncbi:MAG: hypothetical protein O3B64_01430 [bacterium]|nr:hypothetical protein [bacterium]MDA1024745.1 hypothetical protein [bacterium]